MTDSERAGMWVSADDHVHLELRVDGSFDEARGATPHVYTGSWKTEGDTIHFTDQDGNHVSFPFHDDVMLVEDYELRRRE